jgi:hypothetical protein
VLHAEFSRVAGQAAPPFSGDTVIARVRVMVPPPHAAEQLPHPPHKPTWQLTGQPCVLHAAFSRVAGQAVPPLSGGTVTNRVRVMVPPPHAAEQLPYALHKPTSQLTGHPMIHKVAEGEKSQHHKHRQPRTRTTNGEPCVLHDKASDVGGQAVPPFTGNTVTARVRVEVPPPHVTVQAP